MNTNRSKKIIAITLTIFMCALFTIDVGNVSAKKKIKKHKTTKYNLIASIKSYYSGDKTPLAILLIKYNKKKDPVKVTYISGWNLQEVTKYYHSYKYKSGKKASLVRRKFLNGVRDYTEYYKYDKYGKPYYMEDDAFYTSFKYEYRKGYISNVLDGSVILNDLDYSYYQAVKQNKSGLPINIRQYEYNKNGKVNISSCVCELFNSNGLIRYIPEGKNCWTKIKYKYKKGLVNSISVTTRDAAADIYKYTLKIKYAKQVISKKEYALRLDGMLKDFRFVPANYYIPWY